MQNGLISVLLSIVVGVSLIPVIGDGIDSANTDSQTENFVATSDGTTEETFTLNNPAINDEVNYVNVNETEIDPSTYSTTGSDVTLDSSASTTDDNVTINYDFEDELGGAVGTMVDLLPILFVVIIVTGAVSYIRTK